MVRLSFGSGNTNPPPRKLWSAFWFGIGTISIFVAGCLWAVIAHAGCTTIPSIPQLTRRDAVCSTLNLKSMCYLTPRKLVAATLLSGEQSWDLVVGGVDLGSFPFPTDSIPVDPTQCTNTAYVADLLRFETGGAAVQIAIRHQFPHDVHNGDVVFFDELLGTPEPSTGLCTITAQLMVVHR